VWIYASQVQTGDERRARDAAERTGAMVFTGARIGQLAFSGMMLANDRHRVLSPRLQASVYGGLVCEAGWLFRRIHRARSYDDRLGLWVDAAASAAALFVTQRGLGPAAAPWVKNVAIGSVIGSLTTGSPPDAAGATALVCGAGLAAATRATGRDAHVSGLALAVNDTISWVGMGLAAGAYFRSHRRSAQLQDEATQLAVERSAAVEAQDERSRQHESLHRVTISVLRRLAESDGLEQAQAIARSEAARLRYALRSGGRPAEGLEEILIGAAERLRSQGLSAEMLTTELEAVIDPALAAVIGRGVESALECALLLGGARTAVVRVRSEPEIPGSLVLTLRDHGRGFVTNEPNEYALSLQRIADALTASGAAVSVWSEPGEGVRVTITAPLSDEPLTVAPAEPLGTALPPNADRRRRDVRRGRERLERIGRWFAPPVGYGELPAESSRQTERTLLTALLTWRATGLATGLASLIAGRARHRSPVLAAGHLLAATLESAWYAGQVLARERWDAPLTNAVDAVSGCALVTAGRLNLDRSDRVTWINWTPWSYAENVICGQSMAQVPLWRAAVGGGAVAASHLLDGPTIGDCTANGFAHSAFFGVSRLFARQMRAVAVRLHRAQEEAVEQGRVLARSRERAQQLRLLHDHALQTLEAVSGGRYRDLPSVRDRAGAEADRLEAALSPVAATAPDLSSRMRTTAQEHEARGLRVELDLRVGGPQLPEDVVAALVSACHEALTNVAKHAATGQATVRVVMAAGAVVVEIADAGEGFDATGRTGFGIPNSIRGPMQLVGGSCEINSAAGQGTTVVLRWPS
jgi:signal transduction histidine kinase